MKKKMFAGISLLVLLLCALLAFAACGTKVNEISIDRNNMPQTVFVLGNDLDLSKGKLKVNNSSTVSLNSPDVTVTGYNKDQEGSQTLTISYGGKTTELVVTVVPRFRPAEDYIYFLGEEYADAQPRLNITRDDGTQITVSADDPALTVNGFDSSKAQENLPLDLVYDKGTDHFEGSFTVSVCEPTVTFRAPRKVKYGNHETKLDLTGASVTLKTSDGTATRNVALTNLVASGYDPSAVTASNPQANQTVTVSYRGREVGEFVVEIKYSDVSKFKETAAQLSALDWDCYKQPTDSDPGMKVPANATEEMMKNAVSTLQLYFTLTKTDLAYISQNELDAVARLAVVYGYNTWMQTVESAYSDAFLISEVGNISYTCDTLEKASSASEKLKAAADENTQLIFTLSELLNNETLLDKCANSNIYTTVVDDTPVTLKISDLASIVKTKEFMLDISELLDYAVEAFDNLKGLTSPEKFSDWNDVDLSASKDIIDQTYVVLYTILENKAYDNSIYPLLNGWREKADYFDFIYHFYVIDENNEDGDIAQSTLLKLSNLSTMMLPLPLETLRATYNGAYIAQLLLQQFAEQYLTNQTVPLLSESSLFIFEYLRSMDATNKYFDNEDYSANTTYTFLYATFLQETFDELSSGEYGYTNLLGNASYDEEVENLWKTYLELWNQFENGEELTDEEQAAFDEKVRTMFNDFAALMPNQQYYFISSLNYLYTEGMPQFVLYPGDGSLYSDFALFIYNYYSEKLGIDLSSEAEDTAYSIFTDLLCAIEGYANGDETYFCETMQNAKNTYDGEWVDPTQKEKFDSFLLPIFNQYLGYFELYTYDAENSVWVYNTSSLGENLAGYKETFDNLLCATSNTSLARSYIDQLSVSLYLPFLASYRQVCDLEAEILASENEDLINAYKHMAYGDLHYPEPLFNSVYAAKAAYEKYRASFMLSWASSFNNLEDATDFESATGLFNFLSKYANYFWTSAQLQAPQILFSGKPFEFTPENVSAMTKDFLQLTPQERYFLISVDSTLNLYHGGLELGLAEAFQDSTTKPLISQILTLEITYVAYEKDPDGTYTETDPDSGEDTVVSYKDAVLSLWNELKQAYEEILIPEEINLFNSYFGEMYNFFKTVCEEMQAA